MKLIKKLAFVFVLAFIFNLFWENIHYAMYVHYKGGPITKLLLLRCAIIDAAWITLVSLFIFKINFLKNKAWLSIPINVLAAIYLELHALSTNRWAYNELMPIIPFIGSGLSPTIQLALTGYAAIKIVQSKR